MASNPTPQRLLQSLVNSPAAQKDIDALRTFLFLLKDQIDNLSAGSGVSDGDYGDITVSGSGTAFTIDNNVVTFAKLEDATGQYKIIARVSAGSGDFQELTSSADVFALLQAASYSAVRTLLGLVIGTDVQAYDATLAALAAYNTNGILVQTAADTFTGRTITGTSNQVTVTNGDGISGNPVLSLPQDMATTSSPQFAGVNIGAATDTTVARASAGRISVEGVEVALMTDLPALAFYSAQTRTQARYQPTGGGVVAMTSELDIVITVPTGGTKNVLEWNIMGEEAAGSHNYGFIVYRDVDGGGFSLLANSRDGSSNAYSVITSTTYDTVNSTPTSTTVQIDDVSISAGSVYTYRIYGASTHATIAADYYMNRTAGSTGGNANETGLCTCRGWCIQ